MTTDNADPLRWQGTDDRAIVAEMLRDRQSEHWARCYALVKGLVERQAKNVPQSLWNDIIQEVMIRIERNLPAFAYRSTLRTWIISIVRHCIIDSVRRTQREEEYTYRSRDIYTSDENEEVHDPFILRRSRSLEEDFEIREQLREALRILVVYLATREHPERDAQVVDLVLFQGRSREEVAEIAMISIEMVGYIIRTAQAHVRQQSGYTLQKNERKP